MQVAEETAHEQALPVAIGSSITMTLNGGNLFSYSPFSLRGVLLHQSRQRTTSLGCYYSFLSISNYTEWPAVPYVPYACFLLSLPVRRSVELSTRPLNLNVFCRWLCQCLSAFSRVSLILQCLKCFHRFILAGGHRLFRTATQNTTQEEERRRYQLNSSFSTTVGIFVNFLLESFRFRSNGPK